MQIHTRTRIRTAVSGFPSRIASLANSAPPRLRAPGPPPVSPPVAFPGRGDGPAVPG